ncbi:transposase [Micromonospora ureilytica]|uniref:transposase n=1 Tax=Micromonospora ureilytica TaxID=709868 RepID=UPI003990C298
MRRPAHDLLQRFKSEGWRVLGTRGSFCLNVRRGEQPPWIVSDELWAEIEPLLPPRPPRRHRFPGRKRLDDRRVLCGIPFMLHTAIP